LLIWILPPSGRLDFIIGGPCMVGALTFMGMPVIIRFISAGDGKPGAGVAPGLALARPLILAFAAVPNGVALRRTLAFDAFAFGVVVVVGPAEFTGAGDAL
jgi:hypothetical protein